MPYKCYAASNSEDLLNFTGQNTQQPWLPAGFATRSIVALTFSCISAVVGIVSLIAYGLSGLKFHNELPTATAVDENTPKEHCANNCDWGISILVLFLFLAGTADSRNQDFDLTLPFSQNMFDFEYE